MLINKLIQWCPNWLFVLIHNVVFSKRHITKTSGEWLVSGEVSLFSPTPKFLEVSLSFFENRFEKFFSINNGDKCLDVGACIGDTTVFIISKSGSYTDNVYAIEPNPINIKYLTLNTSTLNKSYCTIIPKGAWKEKGTMKFYLYNSLSGHSLDKVSDKYIEVEVDSLDNMFPTTSLDWVKIDVQGAEEQVLLGADRLLKTVKKLIVETHYRYNMNKRTYPKVIEILDSYNFDAVQFDINTGLVYAWR